jgi:hypothetical protein
LTGKIYVIAALKITPLKKIWRIFKQKLECEQLIFKSDNLASMWTSPLNYTTFYLEVYCIKYELSLFMINALPLLKAHYDQHRLRSSKYDF